MATLARLNRGFGPFSAGTRVEIVSDPNKPWKKKGDPISHGYVTVRLATRPSHRFIDQNGRKFENTFAIEADMLTLCRKSFAEVVKVKGR